MADYVNHAASVRISGDVPALCALQHLNLYVVFSDGGPDTSPHPINQEELSSSARMHYPRTCSMRQAVAEKKMTRHTRFRRAG